MKHVIRAFMMFLWVTAAQAGVPCSVPFNLLNGTTADATQVMANYNALIACLAQAASSGANSDITSLTALSTPLAVSEGGSSTYVAGVSTGTANAQVVTGLVPSGFSYVLGRRILFIAGFSNSGPTTLAPNGLTATPILVPQLNSAPVALTGGEIQAGQLVEVSYDGANFQFSNASPTVQCGGVKIVNYPIAQTDDHCRITLGGGAFFTVSFGASGTFTDPQFWVDLTNVDSNRAKFISLAGGNSFYLYPGQTRRVSNSANAGTGWQSWPSSQRWAHGNTQMFADITNGSDANDCLAAGSGNACQHICTAVNRQVNDIDHQSSGGTVNVAAGTYTESCPLAGQITGANVMFVTGAGSGSTVWKPSGTSPNLFAQDNAEVIVNGFTFNNGGGSSGVVALATHQTGVLDVGNDVVMGTYANGTYFSCDHGGGSINLPANMTINGTVGTVLQLGGACSGTWSGGGTLTINGGSTCATFISVNGSGANLAMGTVTVSGAENAGCQKYVVNLNGSLSAGSTNTTGWGGIAGNASTGGQFSP